MAITATDLSNLKTKINNEAIRRNKTGSAGAITARVTVTGTAGNNMTASDYTDFSAPIKAANDFVQYVAAGNKTLDSGIMVEDGNSSYAWLLAAVNDLTTYTSVTSLSTGCQSSCTGLCSNSCYSGCTSCTSCSGCSGCGSGCASSCSGCSGCGGCGGSCSGDCDTGCMDVGGSVECC